MYRKTYIEITNVCGLACAFCPRTKRKAQFMDDALFTHILSEIKGLSRLLHFHVQGEPLLHPELGRFLKASNEGGFKVNLVTNGRDLEQRADDLIGQPGLRQISVSLQSARPDHQELQDLLETVNRFYRRARVSKGPDICLRLWNIRPEDDIALHQSTFDAIARILGISSTIFEHLNSASGVVLSEGLSISLARQFAWPSIASPCIGDRGFCLGLKDQFAVLVDGTVVPCCLDAEGCINLGNIRERGIRTILSGDRAQAVREGFRRGSVVEDLCQRCSYRLRFASIHQGVPFSRTP